MINQRTKANRRDYIKQLADLTYMREELMGEVLTALRNIASAYDRDYNDGRLLKLLAPFIFEDEAIDRASAYLQNQNLIGCGRFLRSSNLYNDVYKLSTYEDYLEDTNMDELFEIRDKFIQLIRESKHDAN